MDPQHQRYRIKTALQTHTRHCATSPQCDGAWETGRRLALVVELPQGGRLAPSLWAQLDPHAVLPGLGGGPVGALAATAPDRDGVRWLALDWLTAPIPAHGSDTAAVPTGGPGPQALDT